jgi:2-keto-4-pentenoate hydratase
LGTTDAVEGAAGRLARALAEGQPCAPVRDVIAEGDVETAYAVQSLNNDRAIAEGRRPVGWKVGLTSTRVQQQLGVDQPDFGMLFADTEFLDDRPIAIPEAFKPRVEAEIAFVLKRDLPAAPIGAIDVIRATDFVVPAI